MRQLGVPLERVLQLGRAPASDGMFNMTRLALNGARRVNGVSRIHGGVSAELCANHWPEVPPPENPIGYVTNGVHVPTFLAARWTRFLDSHLPAWRERLSDAQFWEAIQALPDETFWETSQDAKARMLAGVRLRLEREYKRKGLSSVQLRHVTRYIDPSNPNVLTIGFAQPLRDLQARGADHARPREASEARRRREPAAAVPVRRQGASGGCAGAVGACARSSSSRSRRNSWAAWCSSRTTTSSSRAGSSAVSTCGSTIPSYPLEASGTSGIKAAVNGRLNLSVLDGWWGGSL